jgi:hypothetical protein
MNQVSLSEREEKGLHQFRLLTPEQQDTFYYLVAELAALAAPPSPPPSSIPRPHSKGCNC